MGCLICAGLAENIACPYGWEGRDCSDCGRYRMSQSLALTLMEQGQIFDVQKMRAWLSVQRDLNPVPSIEVLEALLVM